MKRRYLFIFILILSCTGIASAQSWQEIITVEDVCKAYPEQMKTMFGAFNLDYPGLEKVKKAFEKGKIEEAGNYLLDYYKNRNTSRFLRKLQPEKTAKTITLADTILTNVFIIQNVRGEVPYGEDGHRDWYYKGPNNDREWAWLSNRHSQINYVLSTYFETGNPKYAEYIDLFLRDFIIKSMPYPGVKSSTSVWRGLEVSFRIKVWSRIFYELINSEYLSPSTQLLILSSLPDHAHYNRNFHGGNNWLTMEISALATIAVNFPEYKSSNAWLDYSIKTMTESMKNQVYDDGAQTELTSHYHMGALSNFSLFQDICQKANKTLPEFYTSQIENMWSYLAFIMRPNGNALLNNDADLDYNRDRVLAAATKYNRNDWKYIASNGKLGVKPSSGPSFIYPWAGHLISRSGYEANAHWSFFDIGPWGSGHQHNDKLHISISANGRDLLVDAGRFAYTGDVAKKFRRYAKGSQGHNVILIDGKGQGAGPKVITEPLTEIHYKITPEFDYAWNSFDKYIDIEGAANHTRTLFYIRKNFWIVVDNIETDQPRKIETLWHWHPDCVVKVGRKKNTYSENDNGNLKIVPIGKSKWKINLIKGQETPEMQGWYSPEYNKFEPNVASIYSTKIKSDQTFVWLLVPFESSAPDIKVKVISKNADGMELSVIEAKKGEWIITVPYSNSEKAKMSFKSN